MLRHLISRRTGAAVVRALVASALAIALLFLALPPQLFGPVILIALAPLLIVLTRARWIVGLVAGPGVMLGFAAIYALELVPPVLERPLPGAGLVLCAIFGCTLGLPLAAASGEPWTLRRIAMVSAVAVCAESLLLWSVPAHLSLALAREPLALAVASVGGVWAVSFLVWWTNASIAAWWTTRQRAFIIAAAAPLVVGAAAYGIDGLRDAESERAVRVVAVQTRTVRTIADWRQRQIDVSAMANGARADLVVWPELSAAYLAPGRRQDQLAELAQDAGAAPFVTTFPTPSPDPEFAFNTAVLFSPDGPSAHYHKRHPYADEATFHAPGERAVTVACDGVNYGLAICFDSCFPASMRASARTGTADNPHARPDVILLPTLDPPDHTGLIQAMHAASTPFRAAETGRPIVRADITADSMIVDARGRILAEVGAGEAVIEAETPLAGGRDPLAMVVGDGVLYACWAALVGGGLWGLRRRPRFGARAA